MEFPTTKDGLEQQIAENRGFLRESVGATDEATLRRRADTLWAVGEDLLRLGRLEEGAAQLDEAAEALWQFKDERRTAIIARCRQAVALSSLGRNDEAATVLTDLVDEIGLEWDDPMAPDLMPHLLSVWMKLLRLTGSVDKTEQVADFVLAQSHYGPTPIQRLAVVGALREKAAYSIARANQSEAIGVLNELIQRASAEPSGEFDEEFRSLAASGLVMRAFAYEQSGQSEQALAGYEEALARFDEATGAGIESVLDDARLGRARLSPATRVQRLRNRLRLD